MKKFAFVFAAVLLFLSTAVFAKKHANTVIKHTNSAITYANTAITYANTAIKHTNSAIAQGKLGKMSALVEHAGVALEYAKKADEAAKGLSKIQIYAGIISLKEAISRGKMGDAASATKAAEKALAQIQAGNSNK
ncbi:MAG: small metal-binding protein SmbP [Methylobacter sp.]|nr:small metal-binding protein SmbP [Methylobacter sp.]